MVEIVTHLNKAAFFVLRGAILAGFEGQHPYNCKVVVQMNEELANKLRIEKDYSIDDYRKYMEVRAKIKLRIRRAYGIRD